MKEILKIIEWFKTKDINNLDGDVIARAITKLAILRVNLGQELAQSIGDYDLAYLGRKVQYASEWKQNSSLDKKLTQKDLDAESLLAIKEIQEKELSLKRHADKLRYLYDSTGTLIMALQSRIKILEKERVESSFHN